MRQSINQLINQLINQSINQPTNQPTYQSSNRSITHQSNQTQISLHAAWSRASGDLPIMFALCDYQSSNRSITHQSNQTQNQPTRGLKQSFWRFTNNACAMWYVPQRHPINQPINQSINRSTNQPINQSTKQISLHGGYRGEPLAIYLILRTRYMICDTYRRGNQSINQPTHHAAYNKPIESVYTA